MFLLVWILSVKKITYAKQTGILQLEGSEKTKGESFRYGLIQGLI